MTQLVRWVGMIVLVFAAVPLLAQCDCISTGNCPVPIEDNGTFQGTLDVTVSGDNDLGVCPLTRVCFSITHSWIGDLSVALTSPSGANYLLMADLDNGTGGCGNEEDNVDVCIEVGVGNPLTNNTEYVCNPGPCFSGTCCLTGTYTAPCGGVGDPVSGAAQAPNCNLNDFNTPGSPANGTWTLTVNDICDEDTGTLNNFSLEFSCGTSVCIVCEAEGGSLNADDVTSCFGDPSLNLDLTPNFSNGEEEPPAGDYNYEYCISQNGTIMAITPTPDLTAQPPGVYEVCGISYLALAIGDIQSLIGMDLSAAQDMLSGTTAPFCADFSNDCMTVTIGNFIPPTVLDTFACLGECVFIEDSKGNMTEICSSGDYILESFLGCDSVVTVVLVPVFVQAVTVDTTLCYGECMEFNNIVYCPPGPFIVTLESAHGCDSTVTYFVTEDTTRALILPDSIPQIDCNNEGVVLDGSASEPANLTYSWAGPGNFQSDDPIIYVTTPGDYTLVVENSGVDPPCTSTAEVTVIGNLAEPDLYVLGTPPVLCAGDQLDLNDLEIVDSNQTLATFTFHNDSPASSANELNSPVVAPVATATYFILATTSGGCRDEVSVTIPVNPLPVADFTATSPLCMIESSTVTYTGNTGTSAAFNWNFGGGTAVPGTGPGPHTVTWPTGGDKTISLTVTENDCTSAVASQMVTVDPPLPQPVVNCNPQTSSIEFVWDPVPGAVGYDISVAIGPLGSMTSDTSYLITGLGSGELASIFVEAVSGNNCDNSIIQISCTAQICPPVTINVDQVPDICLDGTQTAFPLMAQQEGGDDSGVYTFTGPGVNPISGTFNPDNANVGQNNILVTYEEGTCVFNASININVFPQPSAEFTATDQICATESATITYIGSASQDAEFIWDFNGAIATPGTGPGPHEVSWADGGIYAVTLSVEENGCRSELESQNVAVEEPLPVPEIDCDASTSSIEFFWNDIPNADGFTVNVINGSGGVMTSNTSMLFDSLVPNTQIAIEVVAEGVGICGSSSAEATCTANNCESAAITIEPVGDICLDALVTPFDLVPTIIGGQGGGTLTWSGDGIVDAIAGTFDPHAGVFGENTVTALYVEGNCTYTQDFNINIYALPIASFTTDAPVCEGDEMTITYSGPQLPGLAYQWDFGGGSAVPGTGEGPHEVTWPDNGVQSISLVVENSNGCASEPFTATAQVEAPLEAPSIACSSTTSSISFNWPTVTGAVDYQVAVISGQAGTFTPPNSYVFDGLSPNEEVIIELTIIGNGTCPPVTTQGSCIAIDCDPIGLIISPENESVCVNSTGQTDFDISVPGGVNGIATWSGNGIIDPAEGIFDPQLAGVGQHEISVFYQDGSCSYQHSTTIDVIEEPTADFSVTPVICVSEVANLVYLGNASLSADFTWDLDGGMIDPAQQTVSWNTVGTHTLTLSVEQDGCVSEMFTQQIDVTPEMDAPDIMCVTTDQSVEFVWADVPGATDYEVTVVSGVSGIYTPPGNYLVEGLTPGDEITIEVTVSGNTACTLPVVTASCTADDCSGISVDLTALDPLCEAGQTAVALEAIVTGGSGNGVGTWSGTGVLNNEFDPAVAGAGHHILTYTYEVNANCIFTETMAVDVVPPPVADAGADGILSCLDNEMEVELGGNSSTGNHISYLWQEANGPFPGDSTVLHPVISQPGSYTLTVFDHNLNCSSSDQILVEATQETPEPEFSLIPISCYGMNDGAIIINSVTGGQGPYMFSINGAPFSQTSAFTQLAPDAYDLVVLDANGCENNFTFNIQQPQELNVELILSIEGDTNVITLGEDLTMTGVVNVPEDSLELIQWEPADLVSCDTCLQVTSELIQQTTFSLTVEDNGCEDSESVTIYVSKERNVFVPNAFSPNNDNINDRFMIFADGEQAVDVKSFLVFSRWGEIMHQRADFPPNDPKYGWDGTFRGEPMNPGVYTWFAEIQFIDGHVSIFRGEVNLIN
ncbi:MAG: PKD domain-containing protein [Bacteroidota bacterium]